MSTPDEAVQAGLAGVAQSVGGVDSAGIFGDPAGASLHAPGQTEADVAQNLAAAGAAPMSADIEALQAQLAEAEAKLAEAQAKIPAEPEPKSELRQAIEALAGVSPDLVSVLTKVADLIEGK